MKRISILMAVSFSGLCYAASVPVSEYPLQRAASVGTTVSLSTSAWTLVPTVSGLTGRAGVKVNVPSTNSAGVGGTCSAAAPTQAITVQDIGIDKGENPWIPCADGLGLYLISNHTSAESVHVKEYGQ